MRTRFVHICVFLSISLLCSCANIVPPTGGKKDVKGPELLEVIPQDSLLNTRVTEIQLKFDEFVTLNNASKEIQVSPVLPFPITTLLNGKKVTVSIPDSLLKDNTTYRVNFGKAIKDLHEGNDFKNYNYIFSTGDYFDSLKVIGSVINAATGMPAAEGSILLYDISEGDSAIVKQKPIYVAPIVAGGKFVVPGLPGRAFRIYALNDKNENLVFDGDEEEIAFVDYFVTPADSNLKPVELRLFKEIPIIDSSLIDTSSKKKPTVAKPTIGRKRKPRKEEKRTSFDYMVAVDTGNLNKRTLDITKPIRVVFNDSIVSYDSKKVKLSLIDGEDESPVPFNVVRDTVSSVLLISAEWNGDAVYSLGFQKGFATDTSKVSSLPSRYTFRTKSDDDYGVLNVHVPSKYYGEKYLLLVKSTKDTVYNEPITDTSVTLKRLYPERYSFFIIHDVNKNGEWDTGNLLEKRQPEYVYPHSDVIELKAGWENVIDFVMPVADTASNAKTSPQKRGRASRK